MDSKEIRNLMEAYSEVYNLDEFSLGQLGSTIEKAADSYVKPDVEKIGAEKGREKAGNLPILGDIGAAAGRKTAGDLYNKTKDSVKSGNFGDALKTGRTALDMLKNSYEPDTFDYVLEYLVAEGYADTNQAALTIMANMSAGWVQSIVEGLTPLGVKTAGVVDDQRRGSTRDKDLKDTRDVLDRMKPYPKGFPGV